MLISFGHGKRVVMHAKAYGNGKSRYYEDCVSANAVLRFQKARAYATADDGFADTVEPPAAVVPPKDAFRFFQPCAGEIAEISDAARKLDDLADAMAESMSAQNDEAGETSIAPIMTYLGQFIDHDITANTDREETSEALDRFNIDRDDIKPQARADVEAFKGNLRKGNLGLDSLYGDGPGQSDMVARLEAALRDPDDGAKMRLGRVEPAPGFERPPLPLDEGADLPRVGQALDEGVLTLEEAKALFDDPANPKSQRALRLTPLIGDARNDENLLVAQVHLAFLRLHNAVVDEIRRDPKAPAGDEAVFAKAREQVTWVYQWLVVHAFLKAVCDPDIVDDVLAKRAHLYQAFFDANQSEMSAGVRPMPLEFSVAAFRYGHSMVRGEYDYNRNFGRRADGSDNVEPFDRATFQQMFQFTGGGGMIGNFEVLPDNWIPEWHRLTGEAPASNRVARKIDTKLALPLKSMRNEGGGMTGIMNHLAARNLRRGYVFNLPDAQSLHAAMNDAGGALGPALSAEEIASGPTADAVRAGGFETSTPLWFYILKEAEIRGQGDHLGPLGSRIVAETIVGLMVTDLSSYLHAGEDGFASWTPEDAVKPDGLVLNSLSQILRAGGLMGAGATS